MKRREFLVATAGMAGSILPVVGLARTKPCAPSSFSVSGGTATSVVCGDQEAPASTDWVPEPGFFANIPQVNSFESLKTTFSEGFDAPFSDTIESFSTTRRCPTLGRLGSILAFGGGHSNGTWNGIYRFDIATLTWSTHQEACGLAQNGKRIHFYGGEAGDDVYGEFFADANGTTTHAGEAVARHTYNYPLWLPPGSLGSDPAGYFYLPWAAAIAGSGNQSAPGIHYAALSSPESRWARFGRWPSSGKFGHGLYDGVRNRAVLFPAFTSSRTTAIRFHDFAKGASGTTSGEVQDADASGLRNKDGASFYWGAQDLYIHIGGDGSSPTECIKLIRPTANSSGRYEAYTVKTAPVFARPSLGAWEWVEEWQQLIYLDSRTGTTPTRVHRFIPPANPLTGEWAYQTHDLQPADGKLALTIDTGHASGYGKLQYHPPIGAFITTFSGKAGRPPQVLSIPRLR